MNEHTMKNYTNEEVERLKTDVYNKLVKSGKIFRKDSKITFPMITGGNKNKEEYIPEILNEEEYLAIRSQYGEEKEGLLKEVDALMLAETEHEADYRSTGSLADIVRKYAEFPEPNPRSHVKKPKW